MPFLQAVMYFVHRFESMNGSHLAYTTGYDCIGILRRDPESISDAEYAAVAYALVSEEEAYAKAGADWAKLLLAEMALPAP